MESSYTVAFNGQKAVNIAKSFCNGNRCRSVGGKGRLEVALDMPGSFNGLPNKWVVVSYIAYENLISVLKTLSEIGFKGVPAAIKWSEYDWHTAEDHFLCGTVI